MKTRAGTTTHKRRSFWLTVVPAFLLTLSACNPLDSGGGGGSTFDSDHHPGFTPGPSGPTGPAPTVAISSVVSAATDDAANAFAGGSLTGVAYAGGKLALDATTAAQTYRELDASWTPEWSQVVGYWKLNGTSGAVASSVPATQGPSGTGSGTGLTFTSGTLNQGISFNDNDDCISIISTPSIKPAALTVSAWFIRPSSQGNEREIVSMGNDSFFLRIVGNNLVFFYKTLSGANAISTSGRNYADNKWHHLVGVKSSTTSYFYVDGTLIDSLPDADSLKYLSGDILSVGCRGQDSSRYYGGIIDEVAIWSTALTDKEVQAIYTHQSATYAGAHTSRVMDAGAAKSWSNFTWLPTLPFFKELPDAGQSESSVDYSSLVGSDGTTATHDLMSGILGLWHLDETSWSGTAGEVKDMSGGRRHGQAYAGATTTNGRLGNAGNFTGTRYVVVPATAALNPTTAMTLSIWMYPTILGTGGILYKGPFDGDQGNYSLIFNAGETQFYINGGAGNVGFPLPALNQWTHLVATYDGSAMKLYQNGIAVAPVSGSASYSAAIGSSNTPFVIGAFYSPSYPFNAGLLDEVGLWNRALHANEIKQLYQRGASRLKFQVKSCTSSDCSDNTTWKGPDGSNQTYFSELNNNSVPLAQSGSVLTTLPNMLFSAFTSPPSASRYFQYRTIFEADDSDITLGPQLKNVQVSTSASQVLGIYTVTGTCSEEGRTVTVTLSDGSSSASGSGTCTGGTFSAYVDASSLSDGTLTVTATQTSSGGMTGSGTGTYTGSNTALPANATSLAWTEGTSTTNFTIHASWTPSASSDLANQKIQFYTGTCSVASGSLINLGSASTNSYTFVGLNGDTYSYKITSIDSVGNSQTSACSTAITMTSVFTDNSNSTTTPSFYQGSHVGTAWSTSKVVLDSSGTPTNNAELDASWTPHYTNIVSYWKMNNDWNDSKGTNHGTAANGAAFTTSAKAGSHAGIFDGSNDYVSLPNDPAWNFGTGDFAIGFWFNSSSSALMIPLNIGTGSTNITFDFNDAPYGIWVYWMSGGSNFVRTTTNYTDGSWHHLIVSRIGSTATLYVDGFQVGQSTDSTSIGLAGGGRIGDQSGSLYYDGKIDELAIWSHGLTAPEVQTIYSRQSAKYAGQFTSRVMNYGAANAWDGFKWLTTLPFGKELPDNGVSESSTNYSALIDATTTPGTSHDLMDEIRGLWHLNETSWNSTAGEVKDGSGLSNHGTAHGGAVITNNGKLRNAGSFDGTTGYVQIPNSNSLDLLNFTLSAWIKLDGSPAGYQRIISQQDSDYWLMYLRNQQLGAFSSLDGVGDVLKGPALGDAQWHFVALTRDTVNGIFSWWVDGVSVGTQAFATTTAYDINADVYIGSYLGVGQFFPGIIDEVAIWNRTLSAAEVLELYRRGANRIKFQTRTCTTSDCSDRSTAGDWLGPDGSNQSYFSELHNNSAFSVSGDPTGNVLTSFADLSFSWFTNLTVPVRQYFQYRTILESDDTGTACSGSWCSPELKSVTVTP